MGANSPYTDGGSVLIAGQYLASAPTNPTTDTYRNLQVDASGNLKVNVVVGGGGGGGGGAVTIADPTTSTNQAAVLAPGSSGSFAVAVQGVTGGTPQPVSASSLPLPTGAATAAKQPALGTAGTPSADVISVQGVASGTVLPISAASLPLPTGASTSAKQPALGSAGTASSDVLTVQGIASMTALKVDGSAVTQPVSAASLPLPTGASTSAKQPALGTAGTASSDVLTVQGIASMTALKVDGSAVTQPVSAASLPLPSGASTAAKQPALGTAGTASSDVITVQGIASMTALKVDPSGVTSPVSGTVTANAGTGFPSTTSAGSSGTNLITVQGSASGVAIPTSLATLPALVASTANIGNVGGKTAKVTVTPTVTASSAYASGNVVGGKLTFSSALLTAGSGVLESIWVSITTAITATFVLAIFDTNPTNSTWTDKSAAAINASDIPFLVGIYTLATAQSNLGTHTIYNLDGIGKAINAGATTLYGVLVTTGTPTFGSTSAVKISIGILQD